MSFSSISRMASPSTTCGVHTALPMEPLAGSMPAMPLMSQYVLRRSQRGSRQSAMMSSLVRMAVICVSRVLPATVP